MAAQWVEEPKECTEMLWLGNCIAYKWEITVKRDGTLAIWDRDTVMHTFQARTHWDMIYRERGWG